MLGGGVFSKSASVSSSHVDCEVTGRDAAAAGEPYATLAARAADMDVMLRTQTYQSILVV